MRTEWDFQRHFYTDRNDEALNKDVEQFKNEVDAFVEEFKGHIASADDAGIKNMLERFSAMGASEQKVMMYLGLYSSLESQDQGLQKIVQRLQKTQSQFQEKLTFLDEEYKHLGYKRLMELSTQSLFAPYRNYLVAQANSLKHLLPEDQEKLFVPYFSRKKTGTGLGLGIGRRIVTDHDGHIHAGNHQPKGALFTFELPV